MQAPLSTFTDQDDLELKSINEDMQSDLVPNITVTEEFLPEIFSSFSSLHPSSLKSGLNPSNVDLLSSISCESWPKNREYEDFKPQILPKSREKN